MSDKSFGDNTNRNVVKNPLLSSAVTGLSIEDLTHNAVLLPAAPTQTLVTRQDTIWSQNRPLAHSPNEPPNTPFGDANSNSLPPNIQSEHFSNILDTKFHIQATQTPDITTATQSKASLKTEEEFDVNEYFARLQGTRYVSAPFSHTKEDPSSNLEATEDNLEEINLNDPDRSQGEYQHSLTADIAQNFSQLPTVLPQVASAVFSSFSNMLYKSREHTPDDRGRGAPDETTVPLLGPDARREVAVAPPKEPPKEPPVGGAASFRITTKKKAYAQIPGLTSGDAPKMALGQPQTQPVPSFFIPAAAHTDNVSGNESVNAHQKDTYTVFNPMDSSADFSHIDNRKDVSTTPQAPNVPDSNSFVGPMPTVPAVTPTVPIIPPPPMFSNVPKKDVAGGVGKGTFPSLAKRYYAQTANIFAPPNPQHNTPALEQISLASLQSLPPANIQEQVVPAFGSQAPMLAPTNVEMFTTFGGPATESVPAAKPPMFASTPPAFPPTKTPIGPPPAVSNIGISRAPGTSIYVPTAEETIGPNIQMFDPMQHQEDVKLVSPLMKAEKTSILNPIPLESLTKDISVAESEKCVEPTPFSSPNTSETLVPDLYGTSNTAIKYPTPTVIPQEPTFGQASTLLASNPASNLPPPTFFNPSNLSSTSANDHIASKPPIDISKIIEPAIEPPKPVGEPPKISGGLNYRMTKKRPQYYSGPIEGVGAISNNVKPIMPPINPAVNITPSQEINPAPQSVASVSSIEQVAMPYDISRPEENVTTPSYNTQAPEYNTAFDLSRQTTDSYDQLNQEPKSFDIFGSLKSKLSALDINKIQSKVTTFFDPAFNDSKKDASGVQKNVSYQPVDTSPYDQYSQGQSNFEIFVPSADTNTQSMGQSYDYQTPPNTYFSNEQYSTQQPFNYFQDQSQSVYASGYFEDPNAAISFPSTSHSQDAIKLGTDLSQGKEIKRLEGNYFSSMRGETEPIKESTFPTNVLDARSSRNAPIGTSSFISPFNQMHAGTTNENIIEVSTIAQIHKEDINVFAKTVFESTDVKVTHQSSTVFNAAPGKAVKTIGNIGDGKMDLSAKSFFDTPIGGFSSELKSGDVASIFRSNVAASGNKDAVLPLGDSKAIDLTTDTDAFPDISDMISDITSMAIDSPPDLKDFKSQETVKVKENIPIKETNLLETLSKDIIPIVAVSTIPLFGLSTIIADTSQEMPELKKDISVPLFEPTDSLFQNENVSFFENVITTSLEDREDEQKSERNMCETCRDVSNADTDEEDDAKWTSQLIENITSPIELSNAVEVPLMESNLGAGRVDDYDVNQFAEISQITEDTIETINVQSASDLQSNDGWPAEETAYAASEHDYTYQLNSNALGLFGTNPLFFEDAPTSQSEEFKAKSSREDFHPKKCVPTEEDSKSDETGRLDVHSIEQDANEDFPVFEEFVIEPQETSDGRREDREKTSESSMTDTFTNRLERFKKMEESDVADDALKTQFNMPPAHNPAISIASYFDTGNYAAETHYKNSINSPSGFTGFSVGSVNLPLRIPPGFEEEFQRRFSGISNQISSDIGDITSIPETSTQTSNVTTTSVTSPTLKPEVSHQANVTNQEAEPSTLKTDTLKIQELPVLSSIFGADVKEEIKKESAAKEDAKHDYGAKSIEPLEPKAEPVQTHSLPDPMNFFASDEPTEPQPDSSNRLASYFSMPPPKTDHSKSFFELSQSQNHYRHGAPPANSNKFDIPLDRFSANLNLMKDLTSPNNLHVSKDQVVRTVNFFTVQYDIDAGVPLAGKKGHINKVSELDISDNNDNEIGENTFNKCPEKTDVNSASDLDVTDVSDDNDSVIIENTFKKCAEKTDVNSASDLDVSDDNDNEIIENTFKKCVHCYNMVFKDGFSFGSYKYRKASDSPGSNPTGNVMDSGKEPVKRNVLVNLDNYTTNGENSDGVAMVNENRPISEYVAVRHHWFYRVDVEEKSIWRGFSLADSAALEEAFLSPELTDDTLVATDGGRYDVNVNGRVRIPVYWYEKPTNVRRCSWFYKGTTDPRFVPYREDVACILEEEYRHGVTTGEWHRRLVLPDQELVVMHGPGVMVHFLHGGGADAFAGASLLAFGKRVYRNPPKICVSRNLPATMDHLVLIVHGAGEYRSQKEKAQSSARPRVVRRGCEESEIEDPSPSSIDHLLLLCHGVGSACDMRFRSVEEVVEDFRATSLQLLQSHYKSSFDTGVVSRVEVLPISWHATLHSGETGVDRRLEQLTLDSIPRLRNFTNDTVLDVLFYTSPVFCQTIIDTVCSEMNRIYSLFKRRNPQFTGGVSLGGHSLGSVILYDLLCHQPPERPVASPDSSKTYVSGSAGTGQPSVRYPKLAFSPAALYALGSPIAIFECIRGVESLGREFALPTCKNFFNIFHPYDPIAYRIEPLVNTQLRNVKPYLIPHHKGRKRMHLELKDTMARVGADLKQKLMESLKVTWNKFKAQPQTVAADGQLEKVMEEEMERESLCEEVKEELGHNDAVAPSMLGRLNAGRRIDYVLQEAPLEMINEYLFAMSSHVGYWESEDTMLLMLREIYGALGVQPDCTVPQQSMTVQRTRTAKEDKIYIGNHNSDNPSTSQGGS